jgi:hypothetical protein
MVGKTMNNEALNKFVVEMTNILQSSKTFVIEQAPDVIQQVVKLHMAQALYLIGVGLVLLVSGMSIVTWANKKFKEGRDQEVLGMFAGIMSVVCVGIGTLMFFCNLYEAVSIWVAPKVHLLEYFAHLVRKTGS